MCFIIFKPWLKTPCELKSHKSWSDSLKAWSFQDRHNVDVRWYLKIVKNEIIPTHPVIENINDMYEGKDRAKRQKLKMLDDFNKDKSLDNFDQEFINKIKVKNVPNKSDSLPSYINQTNIIYLPNNSIRKLKISEHIKMVTNDILEAFRPTIIHSECSIPHEINISIMCYKKKHLSVPKI